MRRPRALVAPIVALAVVGLGAAPSAAAPPRGFGAPLPPKGWADCGDDFQTLYVSGSLTCAEGYERMARVAIMDNSGGSARYRGLDTFTFEDMTCRPFVEPDGAGGRIITAAGCVAPNGQMAQSIDQRELRSAAGLRSIGLTAATGSRAAFCPLVGSHGRTVEHLQQGIDCATTRRLVRRFRLRSRPDGDPRRESYRSGTINCFLFTGRAKVSGGRYYGSGQCDHGADVSVRFTISRRATRAERRTAG